MPAHWLSHNLNSLKAPAAICASVSKQWASQNVLRDLSECGAVWFDLLIAMQKCTSNLEIGFTYNIKWLNPFQMKVSMVSNQVNLPSIDNIHKTLRAYWSKRWVETNSSFQNHPNSLEIVITRRYRKPFHIENVFFFQMWWIMKECL